MLERIIRPFQTGEVLATRRIVKSVAVATGEVAILSWGAVGTIPAGVQQQTVKSGGDTVAAINFKVEQAQKTWTQTGKPVTEQVVVDGVTLQRVREITFNTINDANSAPLNAYVAGAISAVIAGLRRDIEGSRSSSATYKTKWN